MSKTHIEPCPFCGNDNPSVVPYKGPGGSFRVYCYVCLCYGPISENQKAARDAWNLRMTEQQAKDSDTKLITSHKLFTVQEVRNAIRQGCTVRLRNGDEVKLIRSAHSRVVEFLDCVFADIEAGCGFSQCYFLLTAPNPTDTERDNEVVCIVGVDGKIDSGRSG